MLRKLLPLLLLTLLATTAYSQTIFKSNHQYGILDAQNTEVIAPVYDSIFSPVFQTYKNKRFVNLHPRYTDFFQFFIVKKGENMQFCLPPYQDRKEWFLSETSFTDYHLLNLEGNLLLLLQLSEGTQILSLDVSYINRFGSGSAFAEMVVNEVKSFEYVSSAFDSVYLLEDHKVLHIQHKNQYGIYHPRFTYLEVGWEQPLTVYNDSVSVVSANQSLSTLLVNYRPVAIFNFALTDLAFNRNIPSFNHFIPKKPVWFLPIHAPEKVTILRNGKPSILTEKGNYSLLHFSHLSKPIITARGNDFELRKDRPNNPFNFFYLSYADHLVIYDAKTLEELANFSQPNHRYTLEQTSLTVQEMAYSPKSETMTIRYLNWKTDKVIFEYVLKDTDSVFPFEIVRQEDFFTIRYDSRFKKNKNMGYFFFDGSEYHFFSSVKKLKAFRDQKL